MEQNGIDVQVLVETAVTLLSEWGLQALGAVALLVVGWTGAKWIRRMVRRSLGRSRIDPTLVPFLASLVYYATLAFVGLAVLNLFGIQTASIIAVLGAAAFAVGLALQGTLGNFSAGVMLLLFRPFGVGDFVEVAGQAGSVVEIGLFFTRLDTPDNVRITVPNGQIFGAVVKNYAANPTRRVDLEIGISYDDDIGGAMETIRRVLAEEERILPEPAPRVAVHTLGDSSVNLVVRPWTRKEDYWDVRWNLTRRLKEALEADGVSIPYPQRDVHLFPTGAGGTGVAGEDRAGGA